MKLFVVLCASVVCLLAIFAFTSVTVEIKASKNSPDKLSVKVRYLFFVTNLTEKKKKSGKRDEEKKSKAPRSLAEYRQSVKKTLKIFNAVKGELADTLRYFADKAVKFESLDISVKFGLDDPMETGIANGLLYGAVYEILGFVHKYSNIAECGVNIEPDFDEAHFSADFDCILKLKNVHITVVLVRMIRLYDKIKKMTKERE